MNVALRNLLALQTLEFDESPKKRSEAQTAELRAQIPPQVLAHYDRLRERGKKGIVMVRNQVCSGCHMRLPIGLINSLMHGQEVQLCDSCGRYLVLPEGEGAETPFPAPPSPEPPAAKPGRKTAKRRAAPKPA
jgi:predicted  nucleic acid-binding Zn-ribbon protein